MNKKSLKLFLIITLFISFFHAAHSQTTEEINDLKDSLYIEEIENKHITDKVLHAEPLYIDLIRDLGARKGEKEWNIGLGLTDNNTFDKYTALVEYEWAAADRLGFEIELPFSFYYRTTGSQKAPGNKLNSIKAATQYTFYVSEKRSMSMAIGYIHELELTEFSKYGRQNIFDGNLFNPFFIGAKRWGQNFHTLVYTGPQIFRSLHADQHDFRWQFNSNLHYMIPGTRNFIGMEFNKMFVRNDFDMTIRPQMRVGLADNLLIGVVTGIPIKRENERFSTFLRLIYEPGHKNNSTMNPILKTH